VTLHTSSGDRTFVGISPEVVESAAGKAADNNTFKSFLKEAVNTLHVQRS
jgi:hypothetical protein